MANVLDLQNSEDPRDIVHRTVQALVEGQVVALPTETTYALAANALCENAVARLRELAGTRESKDSTASTFHRGVVSLRSLDAAGDYLCNQSRLVSRLSRRCWPGPLTIVAPYHKEKSAMNRLPVGVQSSLTSDAGEVGFRVVNHRVLSHLHRFLSAPLILAEIDRGEIHEAEIGKNGGAAATTADSLPASITEEIPLLLDDGPTRYGGSSSIVRVSGDRWDLIREGVIERAAMNQFVKPVVAIVCTGNTCRSPMAETIMRDLLGKKLGCEDAVRVLSAGVAAGPGSGASPQAVEVMGRQGLDLTGHSSRPFDESVVQVADLVLTMTRGHRDAILAAFPEIHDRVFTLRRDGGDISDPVGMPAEVYEACAKQIESELTEWIEALGDDFFPKTDSQDSSDTRDQSAK